MKKEIFQEIEIPDGVEVSIKGSEIIVNGKEGENRRDFAMGKIKLEKKDNKIFIGYKNSTKKEKKMINTMEAHIRNMIKGVQNKFEYKLKICFNHFPINVNIEGRKAVVKNFLGEKIDRKIKIPEGVDVKVDKEMIIIKSIDKEKAGEAASNLEKVTQIKNRDRRVFQDGIFITAKAGREI
ncbi:MAG: 50S ribosomal protein L6 [Candidatus Pacearchaeota archaeon]